MRTAFVALMLATTAAFAGELAPGAQAPAFSLVNAVDGRTVTMTPADGNLKVVLFTSNHCPSARAFEPRTIEIVNRFGHRGAKFYVVNPNDDASSPDEALVSMKARAEALEYPFPYLKDAGGSVARAYGARVTPHVFVVDGDGVIRYRGHIDDAAAAAERQSEGLINALNALLNGRNVATAETNANGCSIQSRS